MTTINISQFEQLKKSSAKSFNQQKHLIKKVMLGQKIPCEQCKQTIQIIKATQQTPLKLSCDNGCTDIELDLAL